MKTNMFYLGCFNSNEVEQRYHKLSKVFKGQD